MVFFLLLLKHDELYDKILDKVSNFIQRRFDSEPAYSEKQLKTKLRSYEGKINKKFYDNGMRKEGSNGICVSNITRFCF